MPITPAGSGEVVVTDKAGFTTILKLAVLVAVGVSESVTVTVKLKVPDAVGVPEITPALLKLKPAGKVPGGTLHV